MAVIKPKSAEQQRRQGWLIVAGIVAITIAMALGLDISDLIGYR